MKWNRRALCSVVLAATLSVQGMALAQNQMNPNVQKAFDMFNAIMGTPVQTSPAAPPTETNTTTQTAAPAVTQDQAAKAIEQVTGLKALTPEQVAHMEKLQAENKELKMQLDALRDLKTAELNRRLDELTHRKAELERHMKHVEEETLFVNEQIERLETEKAELKPSTTEALPDTES